MDKNKNQIQQSRIKKTCSLLRESYIPLKHGDIAWEVEQFFYKKQISFRNKGKRLHKHEKPL